MSSGVKYPVLYANINSDVLMYHGHSNNFLIYVETLYLKILQKLFFVICFSLTVCPQLTKICLSCIISY